MAKVSVTDELLMKVADDLGHALGRLSRAAGKDWPNDTRPIIGRLIKAAKHTAKGRDEAAT